MPLTATIFGSGNPIVLLPGFALDGAVMAAACEPVLASAATTTGRSWQRIYLDLPGTGGSPAGEPTSDAVLDAIGDTLAELIGGTPCRLVGHSYGGYLALGLAHRDPLRVAGLFLICCGSRIRPADRDLSGVQQSTPEPGWLNGAPIDLHEHFRHGIGLQNAVVADRVAAALARRGPLDETYLDALRPDGYRLTDEGAAWSGLAGPVTALAGRRDRIAGYRDLFAALEGYPNGNYSLLAEAGHYLPFEQPERFAVAILDWLTSTTPRSDR